MARIINGMETRQPKKGGGGYLSNPTIKVALRILR